MPVDSQLHSAALLVVSRYVSAIEPIVQRHFSFKRGDSLMDQRPIGGRHLSFILRTPMTKLSKTLIAATAFAAIATSAFSQAPMEFKSGMAHVYVGGKMSGITIAPGEKNHEAMMKNATKVPNNTVFFMNNGQLYSTSGMLDPTGNFYLP
jgi:hypothetical protein